ncbi:MAG: DUF72 domain-containing protein [Armatimonadota bacterium]|nr:DUF72 domain-containing protein [Armatimonadota bacterium]
MGNIYVGTSGWSYKEWIGPFYTSGKNLFSQYCQVFRTTEINSTFYRLPTRDFIEGLARTSPEGFLIAAKIPKEITHKKRLDRRKGALEDLQRFLHALEPLEVEGKLGPLLLQLPPASREELKHLDDFLAYLPSDRYHFVAEFRDESWMREETFALLHRSRVGYCIVDEPLLPARLEVTSEVGYIRWHGRGQRPWYYYLYTEEELQEWVPKVKEVASRSKVLFAYFNNHFRGYAPRNALQMLNLLGMATKVQQEKLEQVNAYFTAGALEERRYLAQAALARDAGLKELLGIFLDPKRLQRALEIPDQELSIEEASEDRVVARIKEYRLCIDRENSVIAHDCDDWRKRRETRQFCKHMGKLFLFLPLELASDLLRDISENLDQWEFKGTME